MVTPPLGVVTFLFTDVEGSTGLWERYPRSMQALVARHDALLADAVESGSGYIVKLTGDGVHAAFASAAAALAAALAVQRRLLAEDWGEVGALRVRMGLHTAAAEFRDGDYYAPSVNRAARLMGAGHGGQILVSLATRDAIGLAPDGVGFRDLGDHHLRDLLRPERIFQVLAPDLPDLFPALKTLDARPNNLPQQPNALVGREREVAAVLALVRRSDTHLVTLTGPGGTGKTRLGLQVAAEALESFRDGAYLVALASVTDADLVVAAIAYALGVREDPGQSPLQAVTGYLRDKRVLLVLDNFEQVLAAGPRVAEVLRSCAGVTMLVTSRAALRLSGEQEYPVPPLGLPARGEVLDAARLIAYEAPRLFVERARAARPDFALTSENGRAVAEICHRLDGLPLAIELAAARVKILSPEAMLPRLERRLTLLTGGARDLPARQQTMRGTIDWSHDLLDDGDQQLLRRLAVFTGGCTLAAAQAVCDVAEFELLDGIASLEEQSLLRRGDAGGGEPRFGMLETIREYALERLQGAGEAEALQRRHASCFLVLAEQAAPRLEGREQAGWLACLDLEHDNLRAALRWLLGRGDAALAQRLAGALWNFWRSRGHFDEGRRWLTACAELPVAAVPTAARSKTLTAAGFFASMQGDVDAGSRLVERGLAMGRELADPWLIGFGLFARGQAASNVGRAQEAVAAFEEALTVGRAGDAPWALAWVLTNLATTLSGRGDLARADELLAESLRIRREIGDQQGLGASLSGLGHLALARGELARARALLDEGLTICRASGDRAALPGALMGCGHAALLQHAHADALAAFEEGLAVARETGIRWRVAQALEGLGCLAAATGDPERALRVFGAAAALRVLVGSGQAPGWAPVVERAQVAAERALDGDRALLARQRGGGMPLADAVAYALDEAMV